MKFSYFSLIAVFFSSCQFFTTPEKELYNLLQGTYTSEKQAQQDSSYHHIILKFIPVWEERKGHWIYAEMTANNAPQTPFAQRVYNIASTKTGLVSLISYELKQPDRFSGKWETTVFNSLTKKDLILRQGCSLEFEKTENKFIGETQSKKCRSSLNNTAYTLSKMTVSENRILNWRRGFDKDEQMIWGNPSGAYILEEVTDED